MTRRTPFWRWWLTDEFTGKRYKSSWRMTEEQAAAYPGAEKAGEPEWRDLPETDQERLLMLPNTEGTGPPNSDRFPKG